MARGLAFTVAACSCFLHAFRPVAVAEPVIDLSAHHADCGITVRQSDQQLRLSWPVANGIGQLDLDLRSGQPLIRTMAITDKKGDMPRPVLIENADPVTFLWSWAPARHRRAARPA